MRLSARKYGTDNAICATGCNSQVRGELYLPGIKFKGMQNRRN